MNKATWPDDFKLEYEATIEEGRPVEYHGDLTRANLARAYLTEANLTEANLTGADLAGTDLTWADLAGTNLSGAKGIWLATPGGSRQGICAFVKWDDGIHVFTGCFDGTMDEFLAKVEETHGDSKHGRYYRAICEAAKVVLEEE